MLTGQREGVYGYVLSLLCLMSRIAAFVYPSMNGYTSSGLPARRSQPFSGIKYILEFWGAGGVKGVSEFVFSACKVRPTKVKKVYTSIFSSNTINPSSKKTKKRAIPLGNRIFSLSHFFLTAHLAANMRLLTNEGPETGFSR